MPSAKVVDVSSVPPTSGDPPSTPPTKQVSEEAAFGEPRLSRPSITHGSFGFSDTEELKNTIRNTKKADEKEPYNVYSVYHAPETSRFSRLAQNPIFENTTLGIIVVNALWISIDTDFNSADTLLDAHPIFVAMDSMFFSYFSFELFVRFMAFKRKISCTRDAWFVFDTSLVTLYAFDPFIITVMAAATGGGGLDLPTAILRLFRLARLSRLVRMLRSLPELMIMIKGMVTAATTVSYTLGLLVLITYVFAIACTQLAAEKEEMKESFFKTVPLAMYSLFVYGTFLDNLADFCNAIKAESTPCLILVTLFIVLASMTVMNMLIGVLCEVISAVAVVEKEQMAQEKVHVTFAEIVKRLDKDDNGMLSWSEFVKIMDEESAIRALESVDIDPVGMIDFAEDFFIEDGIQKELTFDQFMDMLLDLRANQKAQLKDVMSLSKRFNTKAYDLKHSLENIEKTLDKALTARGVEIKPFEPRPWTTMSGRSGGRPSSRGDESNAQQ